MKNLFYIVYLLLLTFACINQVPEKKEIKFINEAVGKAKDANKLLIIEFWAPECSPCIRLKQDIFENEKTRLFLNDNFVLVQVSPSDPVYNALWNHFNLEYQSSVIYMDQNGNEIDRTVSYDGNKDAYLNFLKEVSEGKNLYSIVFSGYKKDTLNAYSNYLLAKKLMFRYQIEGADKHFNNVLLLDPINKLGLNPECRFLIAESDFIFKGNTDKMQAYIHTYFWNDYVPKAYAYLINDLINIKDKVNCISLCREAYKKYPDNYEILNKYSWAICTFKIEEDYNKALEMVQKSITLNPERAGTYSTEAWIHFEMGNKEKAIQLQSKAIALYPHPSYIHDLEIFKSQ